MKETISEKLAETQRQIRHYQRLAEDSLDSAVLEIRKHPIESVAIGFGTGLVVGLLTMHLLKRK